MTLKHTYTTSVTIQTASGRVTNSKSISVTAPSEHNIEETAPNGSFKEVDLTVDVDALVGFYIVASQDVTLKTNNNVAGIQSFALVANIPLWWCTGNGETNPLTSDITKLYFNVAGAEDAVVKASFLLDESP